MAYESFEDAGLVLNRGCYTDAAVKTQKFIFENMTDEESIWFQSAENKEELSELAPFTASYPVTENVVWYLCENGTCHAPQKDFHKLRLSAPCKN